MKRSLAHLVLGLLLLLALPAVSAATHSAKEGGPRDFTVGAGWQSLPLGGSEYFRFAAHVGGQRPAWPEPGWDEPRGFDDLLDLADTAASQSEIPQTREGVRGYEVARGDLDGDGPLPPFMFQGPVTCLAVVGNRASFFYEFKHAEPAFFEGGGVQVYAEDNGPPRNGQSVDGSAFDAPIPGPGAGLPPLEGPTVCPPPRITGYDQLESGNLIVHDAMP
jgi:hypothetical protein